MYPESKKVSKLKFTMKMRDVDFRCRKEIEDFMLVNSDKIEHFEYGHVPNFRTYKIVLVDGKSRTWKLTKRKS